MPGPRLSIDRRLVGRPVRRPSGLEKLGEGGGGLISFIASRSFESAMARGNPRAARSSSMQMLFDHQCIAGQYVTRPMLAYLAVVGIALMCLTTSGCLTEARMSPLCHL